MIQIRIDSVLHPDENRRMAISNIAGSPVSGDDFFDRKSELGVLTRTVEERNNVLLTTPGRVVQYTLALADIGWAGFLDLHPGRCAGR